MVTSEEIRKKLADKREGKIQTKKNINGDRTPTSEEIKEKFRKKQNIQSEKLGYLICESCNGYYELQEGESITDFDSCQCGGPLKYLKTQDITKERYIK